MRRKSNICHLTRRSLRARRSLRTGRASRTGGARRSLNNLGLANAASLQSDKLFLQFGNLSLKITNLTAERISTLVIQTTQIQNRRHSGCYMLLFYNLFTQIHFYSRWYSETII
jgi:hypothetical protein